MMRICVSLMVERADRVLAAMNKAQDLDADLLEWRLDITQTPDLEDTLGQAPLPVISTVRSRKHGGRFQGGRDEQLRLLLRAAGLGSEYLDWEFESGQTLPPELSRIRDQVILSYHNLHGTPPDRDLFSLFEEMATTGAGVVKIVTRANRIEDNLALLSLLGRGRPEGLEVVAFCLGPLGRISRVACPLVGGAFTYAALEPGALAAPGQLTLSQLRQVLEVLR